MFLNSKLYRASLSAHVCMIVLVHSCLQLELELSQVGIISNAVVLVDEQRLGIELSNSSGHQYQNVTSFIS